MNDARPTTHRLLDDEPTSDPSEAVLVFSGFEFDLRRDELRKDGVAIPLPPKPRALLRHLLQRPGRSLNKEDLKAALWGAAVVTDDSLVQCVGDLRAALEDREMRLIRTLPRRGYMLDTSVHKAPAPFHEAPAPASFRAPQDPKRWQLLEAWWVRRWPRWWIWSGIGALALVAACWAWQVHSRPPFHIDEEVAARRAVAVMPLVDSEEPSGTSALGSALTDDIATELSARGAPRVIGRGATVRYDAAAPDANRIGRELKVRYVLTGRIIRTGDRVAVESDLTSVATGEVVRLNRSEYATANEALHSSLARRVASAVRVHAYDVETARITSGHSPDAADLAMMGWHDLETYVDRDDLVRGRHRFEAALRADDTSTWATQGLGVSFLIELGSMLSPDPQNSLDQAELWLKRALQLAPNDTGNLAAWGDVLVVRRKMPEAMVVYQKALEINPSYATAHLRLAMALIYQGRMEEAQLHIERARGLVPTDRRLQHMLFGISATAAQAGGHDDEAYDLLSSYSAQYPNEARPHLALAAMDELRGNHAEASAHMARLHEVAPHVTIAYYLLVSPSDDPVFLAKRARMVEGMRKAGVPER